MDARVALVDEHGHRPLDQPANLNICRRPGWGFPDDDVGIDLAIYLRRLVSLNHRHRRDRLR
jgi:hypothetical protein